MFNRPPYVRVMSASLCMCVCVCVCVCVCGGRNSHCCSWVRCVDVPMIRYKWRAQLSTIIGNDLVTRVRWTCCVAFLCNRQFFFCCHLWHSMHQMKTKSDSTLMSHVHDRLPAPVGAVHDGRREAVGRRVETPVVIDVDASPLNGKRRPALLPPVVVHHVCKPKWS